MQQNICKLLNYKTNQGEESFTTKRQLQVIIQYVNSTHQNWLFNQTQIINIIIINLKISPTVSFLIE